MKTSEGCRFAGKNQPDIQEIYRLHENIQPQETKKTKVLRRKSVDSEEGVCKSGDEARAVFHHTMDVSVC